MTTTIAHLISTASGLMLAIYGIVVVWHFGKPGALNRAGGLWLNGKYAVDPGEKKWYGKMVRNGSVYFMFGLGLLIASVVL